MEAEIHYDKNVTIEDLKNMPEARRDRTILQIKAIEALEPNDEGVSLNEGYSFEVNGAIPQLADGLAKMMIEMNKDPEFGEKAGDGFLTLLTQYYTKLKSE